MQAVYSRYNARSIESIEKGKKRFSPHFLKITVCLEIRKVILVTKRFLSIRWFSSEDLVKEKKKVQQKKMTTKEK